MKTLVVIEAKDESLHLRVSTRKNEGLWPKGVMIEQGLRGFVEDIVLLESEEMCKQAIEAIRKVAKELGWEV